MLYSASVPVHPSQKPKSKSSNSTACTAPSSSFLLAAAHLHSLYYRSPSCPLSFTPILCSNLPQPQQLKLKNQLADLQLPIQTRLEVDLLTQSLLIHVIKLDKSVLLSLRFHSDSEKEHAERERWCTQESMQCLNDMSYNKSKCTTVSSLSFLPSLRKSSV